MRSAGIRLQTGYAKRKYKRGGAPSLVAPNYLQRQFDVQEPTRVWVTDITYIRTYEGWLYLAVVLERLSEQFPKLRMVGIKSVHSNDRYSAVGNIRQNLAISGWVM
jgi:hypothetical protein